MTTRGEPIEVPGWAGYRVDSAGRVYGRRVGELRQKTDARGYKWVTLQAMGRKWHVKVGRVVLEAFSGPANGRLVRHMDDDKSNNTLANLAYGGPVENAEDARRNGRLCQGERHGMAKINEQIVRRIRELRAEGKTYREITSATGVKTALACHVATRRLWSHVQ